MIKKLILIIIVLAGIGFWVQQSHQTDTNVPPLTEQAVNDSEKLIAFAFENQQSDLMVRGKGKITRVLEDDNKGSRHQRLIIELSHGQSLLVAHNIDLAPRVPNVKAGNSIEFYGEYEWNAKGGVIHWTHKDPKGVHEAGWLKYQGKTYQ